MKINKTAQDYFLPYCNHIMVKIKIDFDVTIEILSEFIKITVY